MNPFISAHLQRGLDAVLARMWTVSPLFHPIILLFVRVRYSALAAYTQWNICSVDADGAGGVGFGEWTRGQGGRVPA